MPVPASRSTGWGSTIRVSSSVERPSHPFAVAPGSGGSCSPRRPSRPASSGGRTATPGRSPSRGCPASTGPRANGRRTRPPCAAASTCPWTVPSSCGVPSPRPGGVPAALLDLEAWAAALGKRAYLLVSGLAAEGGAVPTRLRSSRSATSPTRRTPCPSSPRPTCSCPTTRRSSAMPRRWTCRSCCSSRTGRSTSTAPAACTRGPTRPDRWC